MKFKKFKIRAQPDELVAAMAGGGWAMSLSQADNGPLSGLTKDKGDGSGLVAFDSNPENSRILHFGTSEEAQCVLERVLNFASWLLHKCLSDLL